MSVNSDRLALYLAAEKNILEGQQVRMGDRYLHMADIADVRDQIEKLQRLVAAESGNGGGFTRVDMRQLGADIGENRCFDSTYWTG